MANSDLLIAAAAAALLLLSMCASTGRTAPLPRRRLPRPVLPERALVDLYWRAWETAWERRRSPQTDLAFIDRSACGGSFGCEPCFIAQYSKYAHPAFPAGQELSNIYAGQRADGFIPRPASERRGRRAEDLSPPLYSWAEWDLFLATADRRRLAEVFPALERFHRWIEGKHRRPDGLYRLAGASDAPPSLELSCQVALDARCLSLIADQVGQADAALALAAHYAATAQAVNRELWNADLGGYADHHSEISDLKSAILSVNEGEVQPPRQTDAGQASGSNPWEPRPSGASGDALSWEPPANGGQASRGESAPAPNTGTAAPTTIE